MSTPMILILCRRLLTALLLLPFLASAGSGAQPAAGVVDIATAPAVLVMIGDPGCPYCARFEREIAPGYTASDDGKLAPLVRRLRHDPDIAFLPRIVYSPTFVMLVHGKEIGRIVGYSGADLFWMQVAGLMVEVRTALGRGGLAEPPLPVEYAGWRR